MQTVKVSTKVFKLCLFSLYGQNPATALEGVLAGME
jgi:hypothetical protein